MGARLALVLALLFIVLLGAVDATRYAIYVRQTLTDLQLAALQTVAVPSDPSPDNALWETPIDIDTVTLSLALSEAFADSNIDGQLSSKRKKRTDTAPSASPPSVIIDSIKPVSKASVASWGIDRVDQRTLPLSDSYSPDRSGSGTTLWIVDTGIDETHPDFGGRASNVFATYDPPTDCDGHGTHVAGIAGGSSFGVAHLATLKGVKVLDCNGAGTTLTVALGLQYVYANRAASGNVINMSLGYYSIDYVIEGVLQDLYNAGVTSVAAAGNDNSDACGHFPSSHPTVISVASSTVSDARSSFSDFGTCTALFAPGSNIVSARLGGGSTTLSGTSMASPHVAGAAALVLQDGQLSPASVRAILLTRATQNVIFDAHGSPNRLLFVLQDSNPPQPSATTTSTTTTTASTTTSSTTASTTSSSSTSSGALRPLPAVLVLYFVFLAAALTL